MPTPLILNMQLDEPSQTFFNEKRKDYFPPERNFIDAHLTLFHHLPDDEPNIIQAIETICFEQKTIELKVTEPAGIGKGVVYKMESKEATALHKRLQKEWKNILTPQDRQGLWPHITIQNKVSPAKAKQTLEEVKDAFIPFTAYATGLVLWRYLNGPWQWYRRFPFAQ